MLRVTGKVVRNDHRSGLSRTPDPTTGELRPWEFDVIKVLVLDQAVVEVTRFGDSATPVPPVGANVDYAVEVSLRSNRLNITLDQPWAQLVPVPSASSNGVPAPTPAR